MQEFRISASQIGKIMGGNIGISEAQEIELQELLLKPKRTVKQEAKMSFLITKKGNPELPKGAKTYCELWLKEQVYKRKKRFSNKYTKKGNATEQESIDFVADYFGHGLLLKNTERKIGEFIEGECDVDYKEFIYDVKNSWDCFTFPLYATEIPDSDYYGQGQGYMCLWNKKKYKLIYVLSDTPMELIEKEAYYWGRDHGYREVDEDILQEFFEKMTYQDVPDELKIKIFEFDYDQGYIDEVEIRVKMCREYIGTLSKEYSEQYLKVA